MDQNFHVGHEVNSAIAFRVSGFTLLVQNNMRSRLLKCKDVQEFVVENCVFRDLNEESAPNVRHIGLGVSATDSSTGLVVRECIFEQTFLEVVSNEHRKFGGQILLIRNFWRVNWNQSILVQGPFDVMIGQNVVRAYAIHFISVPQPLKSVVIVNNTFVTSDGSRFAPLFAMKFRGECPSTVRVQNNIVSSVDFAEVSDQATAIPDTAKQWRVGHNCFTDYTPIPSRLPAANNDVLSRPTFLSTDPADPDYVRIAASSAIATQGAGSDLPTYIGALPPGPAPAEGDWFTRLQERWKEAQEK
jgi:hypothetical protein